MVKVEDRYRAIENIEAGDRVTGTHPFLVDGEWVETSKIRVGDKLQRIDHCATPVTSIELVNGPVRTYNIEVADAHTFFVEGILLHDKDPDPGQN